MAPTRDQKDRIIVGIDFGTTFSGVAFTYSGSAETPDEISAVKNWPGGNNITSDKVPSELSYSKSVLKDDGIHTQEIQWGYQLRPEQPRLRCLKLQLDPRQTLPSYVSKEDLYAQLRQSDKTAEDAVSDYLAALHKQTKEAPKNRYGPDMMSTTMVDTVLTVPAVWSDAAKDATRKAAIRAGMGPNLAMVSEPEAAATYALKSLDDPILSVGDSFIVCDAGGGTVDLISYEIISLSPLCLEESVPGTGALCGGVFLNLSFEALVKSRIGEKAFESLVSLKPRSWAIALRFFEDYVKRNFDPSSSQDGSEDSEDYDDYDDNTFNVPFPGVKDNATAGIEGGFIALTTAEVAGIFGPIIDQVISLVEQQRIALERDGKYAKGVILVGGFGQSNHLFKSLKSHFADGSSPLDKPVASLSLSSLPKVKFESGIDSEPRNTAHFIVLQPANAWTAVVRGAVLDQLDHSELVSSRKARRSYGVYCNKLFDETKHLYSDRYWHDLTHTWCADHQTKWHIERGQGLPSVQPVLISFSDIQASEEGYQSGVEYQILVSDADVAPKRFDSATPGTRVLCTLNVDLMKVPRHFFIEHTNPKGVLYRTLSHEIGMTIKSGTIHFDLRVDGVVYGAVTADYK